MPSSHKTDGHSNGIIMDKEMTPSSISPHKEPAPLVASSFSGPIVAQEDPPDFPFSATISNSSQINAPSPKLAAALSPFDSQTTILNERQNPSSSPKLSLPLRTSPRQTSSKSPIGSSDAPSTASTRSLRNDCNNSISLATTNDDQMVDSPLNLTAPPSVANTERVAMGAIGTVGGSSNNSSPARSMQPRKNPDVIDAESLNSTHRNQGFPSKHTQSSHDIVNGNDNRQLQQSNFQMIQQPHLSRLSPPQSKILSQNANEQPQQPWQSPPRRRIQHNFKQQQQRQQQQQQQQKQNQGQFSPYSQGPRYQFNDSDQQVQDQIRRYEQQYAAWNQAARNGYYYPPPIYPATFASQHPQASQSHQNTDSSYPNYPYEHQQQQQQQQQRQPLDDDRRIFYGSPLQRPFNNNYHMHHYHPSISSHSLRPPSLHASHAATNYQAAARGFFVRDMNDSPDRFQQRQELQQYNYPPSIVPDGTEQSVQYNSVDNKNSAHAANDLSSIGNAHDNSVKQTTALSPLRDTLQQGDIIVSSESNTVNGPNLQQQNQLILATPDKVFGPVIAEGSYSELADESAVTIEGAESKMNFDSFQKLSFSFIGVTLLAYCAVSPRSLPVPEYNSQFLQNLSIVWLSAIAPIFSFLCIYDGKYNNINTAIGTFYVSFTVGYALAFILEIVVTTFLRLGVFMIWEPSIFSLTPRVPSIILPWVLREKQYRPKRITLFAADFATSCVACPIIEEYLKLKTVQWTCKLPRNFKPSKKISKGKKRNRKNALQPVVRRPDKPEVININCYVSQMMASSLGLKLFDTFRRVLMYTKRGDDYKQFYAVCRGLFPIHELCGTMTALMLARRDILGIKMPLWKILGPAVFIHGMANFRGMKPIFKWNSSTPWSEMQLYPWKVGSNLTIRQLLSKSYAKIVWLTILLRVFGYCIKNYYLVGRQAMKRTTTYSGKLYAFSAKLETDEVLRKTKKD
mmetsp:Transcript_29896/g.61737  ORF Transcript_29896/g.61737 Transcript_29896/m.61737 type:complete len:965 (-) Transcript_29896:2534-5428(-)